MSDIDCLIVGAGLAGLMAARALEAGGWRVRLLEQNDRVGGRLCTVRLPAHDEGGQAALCDAGAQYFTVRDDRFRAWVERWQGAGIVRRWSRGFASGDKPASPDGYPRYITVGGMERLAEHLAPGLDVQLQGAVGAASWDGAWQIKVEDGDTVRAGALLLTPPVPRSLALLRVGNVALPGDVWEALEAIDYEPCLALLLSLDGPSAIPPPGGLWPSGGAIGWIADNVQKGLSPMPAVTIHATPTFSRRHWATAEEAVTRLLLEEASPWLEATVMAARLVRWQYSKPPRTYPYPCLYSSRPAPLAFAGDAFAGPRVEGAALSGLAAADALLEQAR
ncbi:MAG: FAD-dependent oxidoreductase [Candidatus Promineifilaceae bacterium]|nr:FAD-dependent oxidoreductase [Candidatus Promineifilaceae bacterium]